MDITAEKLSLIEWLAQVKDEKIIAQIKALRKTDADWWNETPDKIKRDINQAVEESEQGLSRPHEIVMKETREKYGLD